MAGKYQIVCKPQDRGKVDGDTELNHSCIVVKLTNGSHTEEVCRVGFARENTRNPTVTLEGQLHDAVGRARTAVELLNNQLAPDGELQ